MRKRIALRPGGLVIVLSNVRYAGLVVGEVGEARVFSYVSLATRGAPLKLEKLQRAGRCPRLTVGARAGCGVDGALSTANVIMTVFIARC